jgi:hypothetical protein
MVIHIMIECNLTPHTQGYIASSVILTHYSTRLIVGNTQAIFFGFFFLLQIRL